jgi:DUF2934 family protein
MDKEHSGSVVDTTATATITTEHRHQMIATAAYERAERRAFRDGDPVRDWLEAEAEIDRMLEQSLVSTEDAQATTKRAFLDRLEVELRGFDVRLEILTDKAQGATKTVRVECKKQIGALVEKRAVADQRLRELRDHSEAAWEDLKGGAETLWQELRQTIEQMASRFK